MTLIWSPFESFGVHFWGLLGVVVVVGLLLPLGRVPVEDRPEGQQARRDRTRHPERMLRIELTFASFEKCNMQMRQVNLPHCRENKI